VAGRNHQNVNVVVSSRQIHQLVVRHWRWPHGMTLCAFTQRAMTNSRETTVISESMSMLGAPKGKTAFEAVSPRSS
jgi:hypothetical protein